MLGSHVTYCMYNAIILAISHSLKYFDFMIWFRLTHGTRLTLTVSDLLEADWVTRRVKCYAKSRIACGPTVLLRRVCPFANHLGELLCGNRPIICGWRLPVDIGTLQAISEGQMVDRRMVVASCAPGTNHSFVMSYI